MGWSIYTKLKMAEEDVEKVLNAINARGIVPGIDYSKQGWGWSAECDISLSNGFVVFSGAYFSEGCSLPNKFRRKARQMGFYNKNKNTEQANALDCSQEDAHNQ